jgi:predicted Zn-dependent peptidase
MSEIYREQLPNGLWLLAEEVAGVQSLAMTLLTPAGCAAEPENRQGVAAVLAEMMFRGAGDLDARAHTEAMDRLGLQRSSTVRSRYLQLSATMLADKLPDALPLLLDMLLRPRLEEVALGPSKELVLQSLAGLEDEPQDATFIELSRRHLPEPLGRCTLGRARDLQEISLGDVRRFWQQRVVPREAVLAFAGKLQWQTLRHLAEQAVEPWVGTCDQPHPLAPAPRGYLHRQADSAQMHIAVAYDAVPEPHEHSVLQQIVSAVLSGGMSGRLFTELRERRGLCYGVFSRYSSDRDMGMMSAYAGTQAARAQETLTVLARELRRVHEGVGEQELSRAVVGMRAGLVMQGESTAARAAAIAADQVVLGRPRTLEEIADRIRAVRPADLNHFLRYQPRQAMTVVTVGPGPLDVPADCGAEACAS